MENQNSVCFINKINSIEPIPGCDNIELAAVNGWTAIVQKGIHKVNDLILCITQDAVIPNELAVKWGVDKYLKNHSRVRTVKLKGVFSECILIPISDINITIIPYEGQDMMDLLSIYKYEPPIKQVTLSSGKKVRYKDNPNFNVYHKFPNIKNTPDIFSSDDYVEITRKIHGTNARYGIVRKTKLSLWYKFKRLIGRNNPWDEFEYIYGSHNVQKGSDTNGYYGKDVWADIAKKYNIKEKLWNYMKATDPELWNQGIELYGEIYGTGIQKNYDYGLTDIQLVCFDIQVDGMYLSKPGCKYNVEHILGLPYVPVLYIGYYNKDIQNQLITNQFIEGTNIPHEGIVITEYSGDRHKIVKVISQDYTIYADKKDVGDSH